MLWGLLNNSLQLCDGAITNKNLKVPEKPKLKCMGFTYNEAKLFNMLPPQMRETKDQKKRIFILVRIADLKAPNYL